MKDLSPEKIFLPVALIAGLLLVFLTPPMAVPDENAHFINAYAVSMGNLFVDVQNDAVGINLPIAFSEFINNNLVNFTNLENKQTFYQFYLDSWLSRDYSESAFYSTALRTINPIGYLVSGLGMKIGAFLSSPINYSAYNLLLFGRIANLFFYIIITYLAIKISPLFKGTMLLLSLMPMSIFLAASLSYDAILIPVCFLLFAYTLKLVLSLDDYLISIKDVCVIASLAFFLGGIKIAYLPLLLVLLAIPTARFRSKKHFYKCIILIACIAIFAFLVPAISNEIADGNFISNSAQYEALQIKYLFSHLGQVPGIIFNTFYRLKIYYLASFFGVLGNLDTNFPVPALVIFYVILSFVVLNEALKAGLITWKIKALSLLSIIIFIMGLMYVMYVTWTSLPEIAGVGADYVSGVQGRYFIPIAMYVYLLFSNSLSLRIKPRIQQKLNSMTGYLTFFTPIFYSLFTLIIILLRYWIS